jgi:hypothetical protein
MAMWPAVHVSCPLARQRVIESAPQMTIERIMMEAMKCTRRRITRDAAHERLKMDAHAECSGDDEMMASLIGRIQTDEFFFELRPALGIISADTGRLIGRAEAQVARFVEDKVRPALARHDFSTVLITEQAV